MAMPEAPMHKHDSAEARKYQIRAAGQVLPVKTEAQAARMQATPQQQFRLRVTAADAAHIEPALFRCQNVHHAH